MASAFRRKDQRFNPLLLRPCRRWRGLHAQDPAWIARQVAWLGRYLGIEGTPGERHRIWPIVQISDWGEPVPVAQIDVVLREGARSPATGVMVFAWGSLRSDRDKVDAIGRTFRSLAARPAGEARPEGRRP